jgi:hypothetical protein
MAESDADTRLVAADNGEQADQRDDDVREYELSRLDPAENRNRILSARRRMLLILCTLTVAALGIAMIKLAAWWVTVPPILMLGGYLMLLREASRADAERTLLQEAASQDEQERHAAREAAREAAAQRRAEEAQREAERVEEAQRVAAAASETARIFDISERVRDELYDQYADTERRAVGD